MEPLNSSRRSGDGEASLTKSELQAAARKASSDAERLEEVAPYTRPLTLPLKPRKFPLAYLRH
jgi:hypothetical protein